MTRSKPSAEAVFATLRNVLAGAAPHCAVKLDTATEYTLETRSPSPFAQHKGQPLYFGMVKCGKAYISFHLMPLYMCPPAAGSGDSQLEKADAVQNVFQLQELA